MSGSRPSLPRRRCFVLVGVTRNNNRMGGWVGGWQHTEATLDVPWCALSELTPSLLEGAFALFAGDDLIVGLQCHRCKNEKGPAGRTPGASSNLPYAKLSSAVRLARTGTIYGIKPDRWASTKSLEAPLFSLGGQSMDKVIAMPPSRHWATNRVYHGRKDR